MAWTIETYAGTYMGGQPSNARTAMFELCRAVNERQGAIGITKTLFRKANGSTVADLTTDDLAQIKCVGASSNAFLNLKSIRDAIISMVDAGYFLETSGGTPWTKANLEADIGTDLDADPIRPQEARYWQAMQDALDRLIYASREVPSGFAYNNQNYQGRSFTTAQDAWDDRRYTTGPIASPSAFWRITTPASNFSAEVRTGSDYDLVVPAYQGTAVGGAYQISTINDASIDVDYSIGSYSETLAAGAPLVSGAWKEFLGVDLALNDTTTATLSITTSEPSTTPLAGDDIVSATLLQARVYFDIASVLTDQA